MRAGCRCMASIAVSAVTRRLAFFRKHRVVTAGTSPWSRLPYGPHHTTGELPATTTTKWRCSMRQGEKFLSGGSEASLFLLGQNRRGNWVVRDQDGKRGGLFVSRAAALKYALFENGNRPQLVVAMPGRLELDLSVSAFPAVMSPADELQPLAA